MQGGGVKNRGEKMRYKSVKEKKNERKKYSEKRRSMDDGDERMDINREGRKESREVIYERKEEG